MESETAAASVRPAPHRTETGGADGERSLAGVARDEGGAGGDARVILGRTGLPVFPVMLAGTDLGPALGTRASRAVLDRYVELGGNAIVATGRADDEAIIGSWLRARRVRDDLVLASRAAVPSDGRPGGVIRAVENTMGRLGADRLDLLFLEPRAERTLEQALAEADFLVREGRVGALGMRGTPALRLVEARILASAGYPRIDVVDAPYSLVEREPFESGARAIAELQKLSVVSSRPLAHGFLTGAHRARLHRAGEGRAAQIAPLFTRRGRRTLRRLEQVSLESGLPPAAVALAWLRAQRGVDAPLVAARTPAQVDEIARGASVALEPAQLAELAR